MTRLLVILSILVVNHAVAQVTEPLCKVSRDSQGRVITTCDVYSVEGSHKQVTYQGSRYMSFPTWQNGVIQIDTLGKDLSGEVAYDLVSNVVLFRFNGEPKISTVTPYSFSTRGLKFIRQRNSLLGIDYNLYATVVRDGPTQLLKSLSNQLVILPTTNGYDKGSEFNGVYQTTIKYHIRKGDARPAPIELTKKSLVNALQEHAEKIAKRLPADNLTLTDVANALNYYDSLVTEASINKPAIRFDAVVNQFLSEHIVYPSQAWTNSLYGRVYVGFDVSTTGFIKNITLLSPDNIGFGFDRAVTVGLEKLARVKPEYAGHYALPVTFTFTNTKEKAGTHTPVNTLQADRFGDYIQLDEFVVPIVIARPLSVAREVWGFYQANQAGESSAVR